MKQLEIQILEKTNELMARFARRVIDFGLMIKAPMIEVRNPILDKYSSELVIVFLKDGEIFDVIEFHIFNNGKEQVTLEKALEWVSEELTMITS